MFTSDYYKCFFNSVLNIVFTKFRIFLKCLDKVEKKALFKARNSQDG